ncbi:uncharacterized protein LOC111609629 [Xiphophorus maculatus]|uniref:uncharacterized protein LOC111609629 n=1 Tax=Xiphophorus maculatus TaxID=8083 RepID=UPI000C6D31A8|nr:uncharacterized protein LOC111609629 [Xiphophorus maculatus]
MLFDPKRIGWVDHGVIGKKPPKGGWKAFPAQILKVNEGLQVIRDAEKRWIENKKICPQNSKANQPQASNNSEDDDAETTCDPSDHTDDKSQIKELEDHIKKLEEIIGKKDKEIKRLQRANLLLQDGLSDTIYKSVKEAVKAVQQSSSSSNQLQSKEESVSLKNHTANSVGLDYTQRYSGFKKMTRNAMDSLFTLEEMSTCSVTGKKGILGNRKRSFDQDKVNLVIDQIKKVFKDVDVSDIKVCMAQKLKDTRRRAERQPGQNDVL